MTLVVQIHNIRRLRTGFDQRHLTASQNSYRASFQRRQEKTFFRLSTSFRFQDTSTDLSAFSWKSSSNRRNIRCVNSTHKRDHPAAAKSENKGQQETREKECVDPLDDTVLNSNVSPASIIISEQKTQEANQTKDFISLVAALVVGGIFCCVLNLISVNNIGWITSVSKTFRKLGKSHVARQTVTIIGTMIFVRSGLTPVVRALREFLNAKTPWENSTECYLLKELYSPLELLLGVAALAALAESILPTLISVPKPVVARVVHAIVSLMFVVAAARVISNIKTRVLRETKWRMEIEGKTTEQRRVDAIDKLVSIAIFLVAAVLGLQSMGLDVNSVLTIGGVGGLAFGWAGKDIIENFISGLLIMGSRPFDVGDEITCGPAGEKIEGIVLDVGWYRTVVRNWEREVHIVPNSLFSRSIVLNVTRKGKEWRFLQHIPLRLEDVDKVETVLADMRRIMRQDSRIIQKLHKRAYLDEINREYLKIVISFYVEAPNRDAFLATRQQLYLAFVDCILRNEADISEKKLIIETRSESSDLQDSSPSPSSSLPIETLRDMVATDTIVSNESNTNGEDFLNGGIGSLSSSHVRLPPRGMKEFSTSQDD